MTGVINLKIIINASNLHVGGGIQVASSFISELSNLLQNEKYRLNMTVICSTKVFNSLPKGFNPKVFSKFKVENSFGLRPSSLMFDESLRNSDVCFTVFGPCYFFPKSKFNICGFAQPWIAYPENLVNKQISWLDRIKYKVKYSLQSLFFKRYDHLIVEQFHVKEALELLGFNGSRISVVSNTVSSLFNDHNQWGPIKFETAKLKFEFTLGFIGRPYLHKNIQVLTEVNEILISEYNMNFNFLFTFDREEMKRLGFSKLENFHTVGEINASQCPSFYNLIDALVFPSLLECFSATPIEAMKMKKVVLASDLPFVKEVCKDSAFYFNPVDARDIAKTIALAFSDRELIKLKTDKALSYVSDLPTPSYRAQSYLDTIIRKHN